MFSHAVSPRASIILPLAAAGLVLLAGCDRAPAPGNSAEQGNAAGVPVSLQPIRRQSVQREIEVVGTLWADEDTQIAAKVAGKTAAVFKDIGDTVAGDEPLAQIEKTDFELIVRQKSLAMQEALAKIGLSALPASPWDPDDVPTVRRAKLQTDNAHSRYNRGKKLFEQEPPRISEQEFDDLKTALAVANQDYDVAKLIARAVLEEARSRQGDLAIAQQKLLDSTVRAPLAQRDNGSPRVYTIADRSVSVGQYIKEGATLFRLIDTDLVKLKAKVPERYAHQAKVDQKARLRVDWSTDEFWGRVSRINPQIDPDNRTFEVEIEIANPRHVLKPGAFVGAFIQTHEDSSVVFVPQDAVINFAGVNKVFTVAEGKAKEMPVSLGTRQGDWVEVTQGLTGDEQVVVAGAGRLASGVTVKVVAAEARTNKPAASDEDQENPS
ncbi:MAG: efflux RND transporter periplasmic adaptor subunit [Phycisphaeraceae bacterium]|nr:efflux RND transporter periplasmic adaptor subunit [Phycisphaeraceae bacterium]